MLDIFIDMTELALGTLGTESGARCANGAIAWEAGVPHDRLLGQTHCGYLCDAAHPATLSKADANRIKEFLRARGARAPALTSDFADYYDTMCAWLKCAINSNVVALDAALHLIEEGRKRNINFILAVPINPKARLRKEKPCARSKTCEPASTD